MTAISANWYPDPTGRAELRYWDGNAWTDHVSTLGVQGVDLVKPAPTGHVEGIGTIFTEPMLVMNPNFKMVEVNKQCVVYDQNGQQLAAVNQVDQSVLKKALLFTGDAAVLMNLEVRDPSGRLLMTLTRLRKRSRLTVIVADGQGEEIGCIVQTLAYGKVEFRLKASGQILGSIRGKSWHVWTCRIEDNTGTEIARFSKTPDDQVNATFRDPRNYNVQILRRMPEPLHSLVVASAVAMGTALDRAPSGIGGGN